LLPNTCLFVRLSGLQDRRAFVRDCLAYLVSTLALLGIMLRGVFSAWEAGLLLLGYAAYLTTCILTSKGAVGPGHRGGGSMRHGYEAVSPSHLQQQQPLPQPQLQLEMANVQCGGAAGGGAFSIGGAGQVVPDGVITSPVVASLRQTELVSRPGSGQPLARKSTDASIGKRQQQQQQQQQPAEQQQGCSGAAFNENSELAVLVGDLPLSDALPACEAVPRQAPWHAKLGARSSGRMNKVLGSASLGLQEMLHTKGRSGPSLWLTMLMSPAMLLLHATMPAMHPGKEQH
jgi:Ca2+/Na+ antiporter